MPAKRNSLVYQFGHYADLNPHSMHFHMLYEIIYVVSGIIRVSIGEKSYIVDRDNLIFLSNLEDHSVEVLSSNYERYFLLLSPSRLEQLVRDPLLMSLFKAHPESFYHVFRTPDYTETIMKRIKHEYITNDIYSDELIAACIKEILVHLYRNEKDKFPITSKNARPEIYEIQQFIDDNFRSDIRISELAERYFISPYYLSHCFKDLIGHSPKHYLLLTRLSYAKVRLAETFASIEDIAVQSGFKDANSFIRSFKNEFNMTPNQYRRSFAKNKP